jgi:hypothetical protein
MPYSAPLDVLARWAKSHTSGLTHDELRVMIADADALIDARLARLYVVPVSTDPAMAPPLLKMLSATFALLDVFNRAKETPEWITARMTRMDAILADLATGDLALVDVTGTPIAQNAGFDQPGSTTSGYVPVFGGVPSTTEQYDPSRADDELSARGLTGGG